MIFSWIVLPLPVKLSATCSTSCVANIYPFMAISTVFHCYHNSAFCKLHHASEEPYLNNEMYHPNELKIPQPLFSFFPSYGHTLLSGMRMTRILSFIPSWYYLWCPGFANFSLELPCKRVDEHKSGKDIFSKYYQINHTIYNNFPLSLREIKKKKYEGEDEYSRVWKFTNCAVHF